MKGVDLLQLRYVAIELAGHDCFGGVLEYSPAEAEPHSGVK